MLAVILFLVVLTAYFKFAFYHLDQFDTADEHLWTISDKIQTTDSSTEYLGRIQQYWIAAANKDWPDTRINDKPGVSLAYVSGPGYLFGKNPDNLILNKENLYLVYNPGVMQKLALLFRTPLVLFTGLISIFFLAYFWRLTRNKWLALVASAFILLSPVLVGMSQIVNPDTLLWPFAFASILAFFVFMRDGRFVDGLLAAIFFGFALLSKYVALILIPFFLIMALVYLFFEYENLKQNNLMIKKMRQIFIGYPLVVAGGIGLFALLMPALLVNTKLLYKATIGFGKGRMLSDFKYLLCLEIFLLADSLIFRGFINRWLMKKLQFLKAILPRLLYFALAASFILVFINFAFKNNFLGIGDVDFDVRGNLAAFFINSAAPQIVPLVFSLAPISLFLILFLWIKSIFRQSIFDYAVFALSLFLIIYYYAMLKQNVALSVRYSITLYPVALALAGFGFYELAAWLRLKERYVAVLAIAVIFLSGLSLWKSQPYYFNYTTDLLPKQYSFSKSWGYGGYEAAQFVNAQLKDKEIPVAWSDYDGFCPFFRGECLYPNSPRWAGQERLDAIDYYVLSYQGEKKNTSSAQILQKAYPGSKLVWNLDIDGRPENYVHVYKVIHEK